MKDLIKEFEKIRDLKYKIPLNINEQTDNCSTKCIMLKNIFEKKWYEVNFRVCIFNWENLNLPKEILKIKHTKDSMHVYLEVNIDNKIIKIDPSWDKWLKNIFEISIWDWKSDTKIAVKEISQKSLEESKYIMENMDKKEIIEHLNYNKEFYIKLNNYLHNNR